MWEEFLHFLALIFAMATTQGNARRDFWSTDTPEMLAGALFRLHSFMLRRQFENVLKHLKFTHIPPPLFKHPFHEVNLIRAFYGHTQLSFSPGWVSCLDVSIPVWTNQYACPGRMFVPRKPHSMGNEYHSVYCGLSGIMYSIQLVEGKDCPKEIPPPKFHVKEKLLACYCNYPNPLHTPGELSLWIVAFVSWMQYWILHLLGSFCRQSPRSDDIDQNTLMARPLINILQVWRWVPWKLCQEALAEDHSEFLWWMKRIVWWNWWQRIEVVLRSMTGGRGLCDEIDDNVWKLCWNQWRVDTEVNLGKWTTSDEEAQVLWAILYLLQVQTQSWWSQQPSALANFMGRITEHQGLEDLSLHFYLGTRRGQCTTSIRVLFWLGASEPDWVQAQSGKWASDYTYQVQGRRRDLQDNGHQVSSGRSLHQCIRSMSVRHTTARGASERIADAK